MPAVGSAFVELVLDQTRFSSGLNSAESKLKSFGGSAGKTMSGFQKVSTAAFIGVGAAAVLGLGKAVQATMQLAEETLKLGRQLGITAEDASRLISVGKDLGVGVDKLSVGFGIFEKHLVDGGKQFEKYGISLTDASGTQKSFNTILKEAADKFISLPPGVQRTAFAMDVFGRSGKDLIPILAQGSAGIGRLEQKSNELGTTLSGKTVRATHELMIQQRELQQAFLGVELKIGSAVIPVLKALVPAMEFAGKHAGILLGVLGTLAVVKLSSAIAGWIGSIKTLGGSLATAAGKKDAFAGNVTGTLVPALAEGAVGFTALGAAALGVAVTLPAVAAVWYAFTHDALTPANVQLQKAIANSKGVITGVDGEKHAVSGIIAIWQRHNAAVANAVLANNHVGVSADTAGSRIAAFGQTLKRVTGSEDAATQKAVALAGRLAALKSKDIYVNTYYVDHYSRDYNAPGGQKHPMAKGGIFRAAGGAFIAGEGGYATPAGIGMELVGSRGVLPLDYGTFDKIGRALGRYIKPGSGGGAQTVVNVYGAVGDHREIAIKISRELAKLSNIKRT